MGHRARSFVCLKTVISKCLCHFSDCIKQLLKSWPPSGDAWHRRQFDFGGHDHVVTAPLLVAFSRLSRIRSMRCANFSDSEYALFPKSFVAIVGVVTTLIVSWSLCYAARIHGAELDDALLKRFQTEAPIAWKKQVDHHKKFFADTSGVTIDSKQKVLKEGKIIQNDEYQEKRIGSNYRQLSSKDLKKGVRTLQSANPRYAFELASSSSGEWAITGIHPYQLAPPDGSDNKDAYNRILEPPREIRPKSLPIQGTLNQHDWISEEVKIKDIKFISVNNRECVEVSIEFPFNSYTPNGDAKELVRTVERHSAVGVFDTLNDWVLISFVWMGTPPWKSTYTFSYDENIGGVPFMTTTQRESRNMTTNTVKNEITYQRSGSVAELTERDFTLSAFGFPEPTLEQPPPYWLYSSLCGLVLLVIGAVLYKWGVGLRSR